MISIPKDEFQQIFVKDLMISSEKVAHVQIGEWFRACFTRTCEIWIFGDTCFGPDVQIARVN